VKGRLLSTQTTTSSASQLHRSQSRAVPGIAEPGQHMLASRVRGVLACWAWQPYGEFGGNKRLEIALCNRPINTGLKSTHQCLASRERCTHAPAHFTRIVHLTRADCRCRSHGSSSPTTLVFGPCQHSLQALQTRCSPRIVARSLWGTYRVERRTAVAWKALRYRNSTSIHPSLTTAQIRRPVYESKHAMQDSDPDRSTCL